MSHLAGKPRPNKTGYLAFALLLTAFNLRPAIASISPVLSSIRSSTGLSATGAGLLTTLPLVCFGLMAPLAPRLVRRGGTGTVLLSCLGLLTVGVLLRAVGLAGLFAGTIILGIGVAVANVLMPGIVKDDFPTRVGLMTGLYTMMLSTGPAVAAGVSAPLAQTLGGSWRLSTLLWAIPAALACAALLPLRHHRRPSPGPLPEPARYGLWRNPIAWAVTIFMGTQSLEFYSILAWLPTIFSDHHVSTDTAGALLAVANVVGIGSALVTPWVTERLADARLAIAASVAFLALGTAGLLFDPTGLEVLWVIFLGLGQGSAISLALLMMVLRSFDTRQAMALSGMAQGVGYLIAAVGPAMTGALYEVDHTWALPLLALLAVLVIQASAGYVAGKNRRIRPPRDRNAELATATERHSSSP